MRTRIPVGVATVACLFTFATLAGASAPATPNRCSTPGTRTYSQYAGLPLSDPGTVTAPMTVAQDGVVYTWDVDVITDVLHARPGDLNLRLSHAGRTVKLSTRNGGTSAGAFHEMRWNDEAGVPVTDYFDPPPGVSYRELHHLAPEEPLSVFIGTDPNGPWTLEIEDAAAGVSGTLVTWTLVITALTAPVNEVPQGANNPLPFGIPDNAAGGVSTTVSIAGAGTRLTGLELRTNLTHSYPGDLVVTLTAPSGRQVVVTSRNGGWNGSAFANTDWSDRAGATVVDHAGSASPGTALTPEEPFAAFDGEDPNGVWTLRLADVAAGDIGTLNSWALFVSTGSCSAVPSRPPGFPNQLSPVRGPVPASPVPFGGGGAQPNTITISYLVENEAPYLWDLNAYTRVKHVASGDLEMTLTAPDGTKVLLTKNNGQKNRDVFDGTWWDDQADVPVTDARYTDGTPVPGLVPQQPLGRFKGVNPNGVWKLEVKDTSSLNGGGELGDLSLAITALAGPPSNIGFTGAEAPEVPIPDASGSIHGEAIVRHLTISGQQFVAAGFWIWLGLEHQSSGDLDIMLTSPSQTTVTLSTDNWNGVPNVFGNTFLMDSVAAPITVATVPGVPAFYSPEEAMSAFDGENPNGVWTLTIVDDSPGSTGILHGWWLGGWAVGAVDAAVTLTADVPMAARGMMVTYTTRASCAPPFPAGMDGSLTGVGLTLPGSMSFVDATAPAGWACLTLSLAGSDSVNCNGPGPAAGAPVDITIRARVKTGALPGDATATARIAPTFYDSAAVNDAASSTIAIVPSGTPLTPSAVPQTVTHPTSGGDVTVTLSDVSAAGELSVTAVCTDLSTTGPAPSGYRFVPSCLLVTPRALGGLAFTTADVCLPVDVPALSAAGLVPAVVEVATRQGGSPWMTLTTGTHPTSDGRALCTTVAYLGEFTLVAPSRLPRYFAEGATSNFFDMRLALLNPTTKAQDAALTFQKPGGAVVTQMVPVPAMTRVTVDPKAVAGMETAEFATASDSDGVLVLDRTMSWDVARGYGAHAETAVLAPATTWYLAEGATHSGFDLFYLLQNPDTRSADVSVRFLRPSGAPLEKTYTLEPQSRTNIWVDVEPFDGIGLALANADVSAVIESTNGVPIIVERAMYLTRPGQLFAAGHESAGVTTPATNWFLAEGATGRFFDLFVLIANPSSMAAAIEVTYLLPDGTALHKSYDVAPNSRFNIWVDLEDPLLADTAVSTTIRSANGVPIIVERAMWWPEGGWYEAHNSPGATTTGTMWALAEGEIGGHYLLKYGSHLAMSVVDTYILVANTSPTAGSVKVTLVFEDGTTAERTFAAAGSSRFNVDIVSEFPIAMNRRFGAIVESLGDPPAQIVVERAMYWSVSGQTWAAGTNALATRLR